MIHILLLTAALLTLGIRIRPSPAAVSFHPALTVFRVLVTVIGLPYLALSATTPLLTAWYAGSFEGRSPYRLFALSNFASLLALASYPLADRAWPDHEPANKVVEWRLSALRRALRGHRLAGPQTGVFRPRRSKPPCPVTRSPFGFCWPWAAA